MLDGACETAFDALDEAGGDPTGLALPLQTLVMVYGAQGIIDNGGLRYFFENDFPNQPPYSLFVEAYRRIGAEEAADALSRAVAAFPFDDPHLLAEARNAFMQHLPEDSWFFKLDDAICGSKVVWSRLEAYVTTHAGAFGGREG